MYQFGEGLQYNLLDLLVDAPSSFAALYGGLVRHCGYSSGLDVTLVADTLLEMERREWVTAKQMADDGSFHLPTTEERKHDLLEYQAWLPNAAFNELSLDEVGLWYELTANGRAEWKQWIDDEEQNHSRKWTLDDLSDTQTLIIQAESLEVAELTLRWWLSHNAAVELLSDSKSIEPVSAFTLRDGTVVTDGIKLICRYQKPTKSPF
jgi:hypothetical protein